MPCCGRCVFSGENVDRSKKVVFVSHCILNQNTKAVGKEKSAGAIKEVVEILTQSGIGIIQLPCPEVEFNGGLGRKSKTKSFYDTKEYRSYCRKVSKEILQQIESYLRAGYSVLGLIGVEFSPTCAVHQLDNGARSTPGKGIFIEEMEDEMRKKNFQIPIFGANLNNIFATTEKLQNLLKYA